MSAGQDLLLFILFMVVLGIAWFVTGGPSHASSHTGWFLTSSNVSVPIIPGPSQSGTSATSGGTKAPAPQAIYAQSNAPTADPEAGITIDEANAGSADPREEYVIVQMPQDLPHPLTISGWYFENSDGIKATLGNAADIPLLGEANSPTPITAPAGSAIIAVTGRSPNGTSFRINECTGYFAKYQNFIPELPIECPSASTELSRAGSSLSDACSDFADSVSACSPVTDMGAVPRECQNFAAGLSYNGCVSAHQREPGFYEKEWRVYLNRDQELWKNRHDTIRLFDERGKLVAQTSY
ncbi:MAG: hypothetical protein JO026_00140 [Patescibacteria group bacterium]|nr:hypothetical protein [Patescibacteria group bacterium]